MTDDTKPILAFISYSGDSPEHIRRVEELFYFLREKGIECDIDRAHTYVEEGWTRWMKNSILNSDIILVVCTETYLRRYEGREAVDVGIGSAWEGGIISQLVCESHGRNHKYIPVIYSSDDVYNIPVELRATSRYILSQPTGYDDLIRRVRNEPFVTKIPLGQPRTLPSMNPTNLNVAQVTDSERTMTNGIDNPSISPFTLNANYTQNNGSCVLQNIDENTTVNNIIENTNTPYEFRQKSRRVVTNKYINLITKDFYNMIRDISKALDTNDICTIASLSDELYDNYLIDIDELENKTTCDVIRILINAYWTLYLHDTTNQHIYIDRLRALESRIRDEIISE